MDRCVLSCISIIIAAVQIAPRPHTARIPAHTLIRPSEYVAAADTVFTQVYGTPSCHKIDHQIVRGACVPPQTYGHDFTKSCFIGISAQENRGKRWRVSFPWVRLALKFVNKPSLPITPSCTRIFLDPGLFSSHHFKSPFWGKRMVRSWYSWCTQPQLDGGLL